MLCVWCISSGWMFRLCMQMFRVMRFSIRLLVVCVSVVGSFWFSVQLRQYRLLMLWMLNQLSRCCCVGCISCWLISSQIIVGWYMQNSSSVSGSVCQFQCWQSMVLSRVISSIFSECFSRLLKESMLSIIVLVVIFGCLLWLVLYLMVLLVCFVLCMLVVVVCVLVGVEVCFSVVILVWCRLILVVKLVRKFQLFSVLVLIQDSVISVRVRKLLVDIEVLVCCVCRWMVRWLRLWFR